LAPSETVPLAEAAGRVASDVVSPYPPGVPVLCPGEQVTADAVEYLQAILDRGGEVRDRKSTRLNSSHVKSSYAVFCLKKNNQKVNTPDCSTRPRHTGLLELRPICLTAGLTETAKCGHPCSMHKHRTIAIIGAYPTILS